MKRIVLLTVIALLLSVVLSSCAVIRRVIPPKDEMELWERIDETMNDVKSYRCDAVVTISFEYNGIDFSGRLDLTTVVDESDDGGDWYYYQKSNSRMSTNGSLVEDTEDIVVYEDGKAYVCVDNGDNYSHITSELSKEQFKEEYVDVDDDIEFDISPEDARKREMKRLKGGKWELSYSDFSSEALEEALETLNLDEFRDESGISVSDIEISLTTDENYRVIDMTISFVGDDSSEPALTMDVTYSQYNEVERVSFDKDTYTEVDDVRVATWIDAYFEDVIERDRVEFTMYVKQYVSSAASATGSYEERDNVSFKNTHGDFTYSIGADINGQEVKIEYGYGSQTVYVGNQSQKVTQSQSEAREFIMSLLNASGYDPVRVKDIIKSGKNSYRIELNIYDPSEYRQLMISLGTRYTGSEMYIDVTMDGEDIKSIRTYLIIYGNNSKVYSYTAENNIIIEYD